MRIQSSVSAMDRRGDKYVHVLLYEAQMVFDVSSYMYSCEAGRMC